MKESRGIRFPILGFLILVMVGTAALTMFSVLRWRRAEEYAKARDLINITYDKNVLAQWGAADDLVRMGTPAIPALRDALWEENERTRYWAAYCLGKLGPKASGAAPELLAMLKNRYESRDVRAKAAEALGRMGPAAKAVVPELIKLLNDPYSGMLAIHALNKIDPAEAAKAGVSNIHVGL